MDGIRLKPGQPRKSVKRSRITRQKHRYDGDDTLTFAELGMKPERHLFARKYSHVLYSNYPNQFKSIDTDNGGNERSVEICDDTVDINLLNNTSKQPEEDTVTYKQETNVSRGNELGALSDRGKNTSSADVEFKESVSNIKDDYENNFVREGSETIVDTSIHGISKQDGMCEQGVVNCGQPMPSRVESTKPTVYAEHDTNDKLDLRSLEHNRPMVSASDTNDKISDNTEDISSTDVANQSTNSTDGIEVRKDSAIKLPRIHIKSTDRKHSEFNIVSKKPSAELLAFDESFTTIESPQSIYYRGGHFLSSTSSADSFFIARTDSRTSLSSEDEPKPLSISDSEECDTDLELDENFGKDPIPEADLNIGKKIYRKACDSLSKPPQRYILKSLPERSMTLRNRSLGKDGIVPLCKALKDNMRVERLNLDSTDIGDAGIQYVTDMLLENVTISHLNLANNSLGRNAAQLISHVMVTTKYLSHLNLSGNKLGDDAAWYLSSGIGSNVSITHLDLGYNNFEERGGMFISSGLVRNTRIVYLSLRWNKILGKGAVAIFQSLMVNAVLEVLDMSWNAIGYEGTVALSKCLKTNGNLRTLDVSNNRLEHRCSPLLAEGLRSNSTLKRLKVACNPLSTTGCMDILEAVATEESVVNFLDCSDIPVLGEADLLAATICRRRKFHFIHGGIVPTHDRIGERLGRELNPMLRIIEYLRLLGLRPLELLKSFDKTASFELPRQKFVEQIKKIGVKLHTFEIEALANSVSGKGYNKNVINYRKLSMAVREVVQAERERKIKEREEWIQMKKQHEKILRKTQLEMGRNNSPLRGLTDVDALRLTSVPTSGMTGGSRDSLSSRTSLLTSKVNLSMCSPLDSSTSNLDSSKKKRKLKRKKLLKK